MNERLVQYITGSVLVVATALLVATLAWGVAAGRLSVHGRPAQEASAARELFKDGEEQGLIALGGDGRRLFSVSLPGGELSASRELPGKVRSLVPTPGGVSVWVTVADRSAIEVYATSDLTQQATVRPEAQLDGKPEHLTFSENGERLFVTWMDRDVISVYSHDRRRLSLIREIRAEGTRGRVLRDRRATRIYRMDERGDLVEFFVQNGERIAVHDGPGFAPHSVPAFGPDFRTVWGLNADGSPVAVDIRRGTAFTVSAAELDIDPGDRRAAAPVVPSFVSTPQTEGAQSDDRSDRSGRIAGYHAVFPGPRAGQLTVVRGASRTQVHTLTEARPAAVAAAGNGGLAAISEAGELVIIDGWSMEIESLHEAEPELADAGVAGLVAWRIRSSGNFACF